MKIDLNNIDRERFRVREVDGLTLINPDAAMWDWRDDELHMRSLLCRDDGEVVSAGFPKFFNYGERKDHAELWHKFDVKNILYKEDGTLIIASLIDGKLHLRTRGNHNLGDFNDRVCGLIDELGVLEDIKRVIVEVSNKWGARNHCVSLLMEYVSPDNRIVLTYDKPSLVILGAVVYGNHELKVVSPEAVRYRLPLPSPEVYPFKPNLFKDGADVANSIANMPDNIEGFVVQLYNWDGVYHQVNHLIKMKTKWYVRMHGLMTETESRIDELLFYERIFTEQKFLSYFQGLGFDWETCMFLLDNKGARAKMDEMKERVELVKAGITLAKRMKSDVDSGRFSRKEIAMNLQNNVPREIHGVIFGYLDDKHQFPAMSHISGIPASTLKSKSDLPPLDMLLNYE